LWYQETQIYKEAIEIFAGRAELAPVFKAFAKWMGERYGVRALNFRFGKVEYDQGDRHFLYIMLQDRGDYLKLMAPDGYTYIQEYCHEIAEKFAETAIDFSYAAPEQLTGLLVSYKDFSLEARTDANCKASQEVAEWMKIKYARAGFYQVYPMGTDGVVFYMTDDEVAANATNGVSESILHEYREVLKAYDEFDFYTDGDFKLKFDSKENVDQNYQGNMYFYFK
jgi:hypothetical protein